MRLGTKAKVASLATVAVTLAGAISLAVAATPNGNFETGTFANWEVSDSGSPARATATGDWQVYKGKLKVDTMPRRGELGPPPSLQAPPQGTYAAGMYSNGPGRHILHRVLVADGKSTLSLKLAYNNTGGEWFAPKSLDPSGSARGISGGSGNQQIRIDLMKPDAPLDSLKKSDIIKTVFRTKPGDKTKSRYSRVKTGVPSGEFRLRIAEVDNTAPMAVGVDAVKLEKG